MKDLHSKTSRAYAIKLSHSRLEPVTKAAKTVKGHWNGIMNWHVSRVNNGVLEGINSMVQAAKAKARGYRTTNNMIIMCYIIAGKLDFGTAY